MPTAATTDDDQFIAHHEATEKALPGADLPWLVELRGKAIEAYRTLGWPTTRDEAWKHTNLKPLRETAFGSALASGPGTVTADQLAAFELPGVDAYTLVFVDGHYSPDLSNTEPDIGEATVRPIGDVLADSPDALEGVLAQVATWEDHTFRALNTALFHDGAVVHIPRGAHVETPIHLVFLSTARDEPVATHVRNVVIADESSEATLVETYAGLGDDVVTFTNAVTEVVAGPNATLDHYKLGRESERAFHVATQHTNQDRDSNVTSDNICIGGGLVRNDINTVLDAEGAETSFNGIYVLHGDQHVDNHTRIDHIAPHCTSHELYKGVLDDSSRGVFLGRIYVHPGAQKTDAIQHNPNLLLSNDALVNTTPQLEIFADDVKCTHGSTFGQLERDAVFYLRSRGIDEATARSVLTYAFAGEVVKAFKLPAVRTLVNDLILARLPNGELARDAI